MPLKVNTNEPDGNVVAAFVPALTSPVGASWHLYPTAGDHRLVHIEATRIAREEAASELRRALAHPDPLAACRLLADKLRGAP